jgi:hypothetical protein
VLVVRQPADGRWHLRYADGAEYVVDAAAPRVWGRWPRPMSDEDATTYLLGPVMGFLLRARGTTCLHASAVEVGGEAVVIAGPAGAGKSTTAAAFALAGHRVLCDDIAPLLPRPDGGWDVQPAFPQLRLWPDATGSLFGHADALPPLTPTWDKRRMDLAGDVGRFHDAPLRLGAVYLLADRDDALEEPRIEPAGGARGVLDLVANVYMGYLPGAEAHARDLRALAALARAVPVARVVPPGDPARIGGLVAAIVADRARRAPLPS